ncbi:MAG: hypothetical protein KKC80_05420 [Candidatus Margulisbacteria bacterium]|nr:hypothetical protein [Candidatus Margulisiibacteriota bacterium]
MEDEINIKEYIDVIIKRWLVIVLVTGIVLGFVLITGLREPPVFEAKTTVLIRGNAGSGMSQYAGLAGMLGINVGGVSSIGELTELLKSRAVAEKVLDDLKLTQRIKGWDNPKANRQSLISSVGSMVKLPKVSGNVIEIKAEANDAQLAADLTNGFVSNLAYYWNQLNFTQAQKKLKYIETELPRIKEELQLVEDKMSLSSGFSFQGGVQRDFEIYNSVYTMLRKEYESTKLEASGNPSFFCYRQSRKAAFTSQANI